MISSIILVKGKCYQKHCKQRRSSSVLLTVKWYSLSRVQLFAAPWTVTHQTTLSMGFCRQEYWSGLLFPSAGIFATW